MRKILPAAACAALLFPAATAAQTTFQACVVPDVGVVYMIGQTETPTECLSTNHQLVTWTEGLADGSVTTAKIAQGAIDSARIAAGAIGRTHFGANAIPARVIVEVTGGTSASIVQARNATNVTRIGTGEYEILLNSDGTFIASEMVWMATTRATSGSASVLMGSFANTIRVYTHNAGGLADYNFYVVGY